MARKKHSPKLYYVGKKQLTCMFCQHDQFHIREVKLNTTGMSALNLDWMNSSADGLICAQCGYVHLFHDADLGYRDV